MDSIEAIELFADFLELEQCGMFTPSGQSHAHGNLIFNKHGDVKQAGLPFWLDLKVQDYGLGIRDTQLTVTYSVQVLAGSGRNIMATGN